MKRLLLSFAVCLFANALHAAPEIDSLDGEFNYMSTVTIAGTGFSTHADFNGASHAIPSHLAVVWKDFENSSLVSDGMSVFNNLTDHWQLITNGTNRNNSGVYGRRFFSTSRFAGLRHIQNSVYTTGTYYESWWMQTPDQANNCGAKFERLYYGPSDSVDNVYMMTGDCPGWGPRAFSECGNTGTNPCIPSPTTEFGTGEAIPNNTWVRFDMYHNAADGEVALWKNMEKIWTKRRDCTGFTNCDQEEWMKLARYSPNGRSWHVGHEVQDLGVGNCDLPTCGGVAKYGEWYVDDIYFDYDRAHVELCDKTTWTGVRNANGAVVCETQIPVTWSNTSILINFNTGSFDDGDTAYLYVITRNSTTETDDVNEQGYEITIGEAGEGGGEDPGEGGGEDPGSLPVFDGDGILIGYDEDDE